MRHETTLEPGRIDTENVVYLTRIASSVVGRTAALERLRFTVSVIHVATDTIGDADHL